MNASGSMSAQPPHMSPTEYTINIRSFFLQKRDRIVFLTLVIITLTLLMPMYHDYYMYYNENNLHHHHLMEHSKAVLSPLTAHGMGDDASLFIEEEPSRRAAHRPHLNNVGQQPTAFVSMHVEEALRRELSPPAQLCAMNTYDKNQQQGTIEREDDSSTEPTTTQPSTTTTTTTATNTNNNNTTTTIFLSMTQIIQRLLIKYTIKLFLYIFLLGAYWKFHNVMNFIFRNITTSNTTRLPNPSMYISFLRKISLSPHTILLLSEITRCAGSTLWVMCVHLVLGKHAPAYLWILVYACLGSVAMEMSQTGSSTSTHTTTYIAMSFMVSGDLFIMIYFLDYTLGYCLCVAVSILIIQVMTIELIDFMRNHSIAFVQQREVESLKHMTNLYKNLYMSAPDTFISCVYCPQTDENDDENDDENECMTNEGRSSSTMKSQDEMGRHHLYHNDPNSSGVGSDQDWNQQPPLQQQLANIPSRESLLLRRVSSSSDPNSSGKGASTCSSRSNMSSNSSSEEALDAVLNHEEEAAYARNDMNETTSTNKCHHRSTPTKNTKYRGGGGGGGGGGDQGSSLNKRSVHNRAKSSSSLYDDPYQCLKHFKVIQYNHAACDMLGYQSDPVSTNNNNTNNNNSKSPITTGGNSSSNSGENPSGVTESLTLADLILNPNEHSSEELKSAVLGGNDATIHELQLKSMTKLRNILFDIMDGSPHSSSPSVSSQSDVIEQDESMTMTTTGSSSSVFSGGGGHGNNSQRNRTYSTASLNTTTSSTTTSTTTNTNPNTTTTHTRGEPTATTNTTTTTATTTTTTTLHHSSTSSQYSHDRIIPLFILGKNGSIMTCSLSVSRIVLYDTSNALSSSPHKSSQSNNNSLTEQVYPVYYNMILHDLTQKYKLLDELNIEKEKAVQANNAKSQFLAQMSHELRTPLHGIIGLTDVLLQSPTIAPPPLSSSSSSTNTMNSNNNNINNNINNNNNTTTTTTTPLINHSASTPNMTTSTNNNGMSFISPPGTSIVIQPSCVQTSSTQLSTTSMNIMTGVNDGNTLTTTPSTTTTTTTNTAEKSLIPSRSSTSKLPSPHTTTITTATTTATTTTSPPSTTLNGTTTATSTTSMNTLTCSNNGSLIVSKKSSSLSPIEYYYNQQAQQQQQYTQFINTIQTIKYSGNILLGLINDLLDICKIESSKIQLECKTFNLRRALKQIHCGIFQHQAQQKNLNFTIDINPNVPTYVVGDENRLVQILINLVYNAIKFTDQGSVSLSVEKEESLKTLQEGNTLAPENDVSMMNSGTVTTSTTTTTTGTTNNTFTTTTNGTSGSMVSPETTTLSTENIEISSSEQQHSMSNASPNVQESSQNVPQSCTLQALGSSNTPQYYTIKFKVTDTGIGISPNDLCKLFRPFSQLHSSSGSTSCPGSTHKTLKMKKVNEGTGLGLYICKQLVELMGGELNVKSEEGKGSCFYFSVKLGIDESSNTPKDLTLQQHSSVHLTSTPEHMVEAPSSPMSTNDVLNIPQLSKDVLSKLNILIVEDNSINRIVLINMLKKLGCQNIDTAKDGVEGCELYTLSTSQKDNTGSSKYYDIAFIDIYMPRMNGYGVVQHILESESKEAASKTTSLVRSPQVQPEEQPHRHHTILVALTANGFEETRNHCLSNGFDVFMSKPFSMSEFSQCLAECVRLIEKYNG
ncbi:hypothetical protein C9374_014545 [Naegleria lovaniensis]|uniref:histidine kinase n=1 Tax=Naegleria lovaniensis TaxID=51637 RepID=A0AA88GY28_NAELO|nr:uncharacterized protein C9374_014545 [Naegleria lovaniensis]KAG2389145.1 hypothetical protein C9374_014545 [Naegleria lovaniensis]